MSVFDEARKYISRSLIESYFPGGEWRADGDYWVCSPLRADKKIGSFHISDEGLWHDFADGEGNGGDLIDLVAQVRGVSKKEAAEDIVRASGGVVEAPQKQAKKKAPKIAPMIPIPESARDGLNQEIKSEYATSKHGKVVAGWKYFTVQKEWAFSVARFDKLDGSKDVIPYYYGTDNRWHEGQAFPDARPLYNLVELIENPDLPVLVVEGEKCASVKVPGWVLVSWSSGASSVTKSDWSPLEGRSVTIWPDADEPGRKAALAVKNRLPGAQIMDIVDRPEGWDIADAVAEGVNPLDFIASCPVISDALPEDAPDAETAQFFRCLGYDAERYWFLKEGKRSPQSIGFGSFTGSKIQELAPLAFWGVQNMVSDQGVVKVALAQDWLVKIQESCGRFDPDLLRGAGVWRDGDDFIINDGRQIVTRDGNRVPYSDYHTQFHYLSSDVQFDSMTGEAATKEEGFSLAELFAVQGFQRKSHTIAVLGWCLISTFGGVLEWRPHIWISGKKGTGKSWVLDNLVRAIAGRFAHNGTGKDSEAVLRRILRTDARSVILDEMESMDKRSAESVTQKLTLARNCSSDASALSSITAPDGGVMMFRTRACFCFSSIAVPDRGAAVESRILRTELRWHTKEAMRTKREKSSELMRSCMRDPSRYRRRIFRALPRIIDDIEEIRKNGMLNDVGDLRDIDQWAPLLAACWALVSDESITTEARRLWVKDNLEDIAKLKEEQIEDEDRVIEHILAAQIETDGKTRRTIAEMLMFAGSAGTPTTDARDTLELLSRYGVKLVTHGNEKKLAIESRSDAIARWLKDTPYAEGYDMMLKRHALCSTPGECATVRMGARQVRARLFDWKMFKAQYLGEKEAE